MTNGNPDPTNPNRFRAGPIRHWSLSPELLQQIRGIYEIIGRYLDTTLEQFEISFMRDTDPEAVVVLWCSIAAAWIRYHELYLGKELLCDEEEKTLLRALLAISVGIKDADDLDVPIEVGKRLRSCYIWLGG